MRQALKFVLVIGVLLGLLAQTAVVTASPVDGMVAATGAPMTMSADCLKMMKSKDGKARPCEGMTLACIAGMGCPITFTLSSGPRPVGTPILTYQPGLWQIVSRLEGRSVQPEPHPPSPLA